MSDRDSVGFKILRGVGSIIGDLVKSFFRGLGNIFTASIAAAIVGGVGGGVLSLVNQWPFWISVGGGAALLVVAVLVFTMLAILNH